MNVSFVWGLIIGAGLVLMFRPAINWTMAKGSNAGRKTKKMAKSTYNWMAAAALVVMLFMVIRQGGT